VIEWLALPVLASVLLHLTARPIAARLAPAAATRLLTGLALTAALTSGLVLSAAAVLALAQLPVAAHAGHWSAAALRHADSLPGPAGFLAGGFVTVLLSLALRRCWLAAAGELAARTTIRQLSHGGETLVIVEDDKPIAYAVGTVGGRVVVSTGMLTGLDPDQRRVLLQHELAHLRHRHQVFVQLTELAAAANPLLRPVVGLVRSSAERWADETAAAAVGDRVLAARALAGAALLRSRFTEALEAAPGLAAAESDVPARVRALLQPPTGSHGRLTATLLLAGGTCWLAAAILALRAHGLIEAAQAIASR
jgi:Zn-dependent protease with chaperone function